MKDCDVLDIVLQTADELTKNGHDWEGDIWDFVSASVAVCDDLSSSQVQSLHKEMCGGSFVTGQSEILFSYYRGRQHITVFSTEVVA